MTVYKIFETNGEILTIDEAGNVLKRRTSRGEVFRFSPDGSWRITGGYEVVNNFGNISSFDLPRLFSLAGIDGSKVRFKNGKPKIGLLDIDHGTHRMHGKPAIDFIIKEEE